MKDWFEEVYEKQTDLQHKISNCSEGDDIRSPVAMYNSATAAMVEIGEMLQEDTRWKKTVTGSTRQPVYDRHKVLEELADVFIYLLNVGIYSGFSSKEIETVIDYTINKNIKRLIGG